MALDKGDFIGREALARIRAEPLRRKLSTLSVEGFAPLIGGEAILIDGQAVGTTTSAGYGYTLGRTVALGYLPVDAPGTHRDRGLWADLAGEPRRAEPLRSEGRKAADMTDAPANDNGEIERARAALRRIPLHRAMPRTPPPSRASAA